MHAEIRTYSLPRWRLTRWLVDAGPDVPDDIRTALVGHLFGTLPVFAGGVINTVMVSAAVTARLPTAPFIAWLALELTICFSRLFVLMAARRAALAGCRTPTDIYLLLGIAWSLSVGYGVLVSLVSGDWVVATLACLSAAAMVGGICFRSFSAPRYAGAMIITSLGPCLPGVALAGQPLLYLVFAQLPMYATAMIMAAFKLNKMLIATMRAGRENDHRARHDALTGLANRAGFAAAADRKFGAAQLHGRPLALLFLDLDGFKTVNDTYGHAVGDRLLRMIGERLKRELRATDIAARIGGDEFVVVTEGVGRDRAIEFAQRLITAISALYDVGDGITVTVGVSIGIAMAPGHGSDVADVLAAADAALYEAKSNGKARCRMASPVTGTAALRRLQGQRSDAATRTDVAA